MRPASFRGSKPTPHIIRFAGVKTASYLLCGESKLISPRPCRLPRSFSGRKRLPTQFSEIKTDFLILSPWKPLTRNLFQNRDLHALWGTKRTLRDIGLTRFAYVKMDSPSIHRPVKTDSRYSCRTLTWSKRRPKRFGGFKTEFYTISAESPHVWYTLCGVKRASYAFCGGQNGFYVSAGLDHAVRASKRHPMHFAEVKAASNTIC